MVDGIYTTQENGDVTYQERSQEELDQIAALVRTAVGFDESRGDSVEVVNLRFAETPMAIAADTGSGGFLQLTKQDYFYIAENVVLLLIGMLVLLLVVRPLVRRILAESPNPQGAQTASITDQSSAQSGEQNGEQQSLPAPAEEPAATPQFIEAAKSAGTVQAQVMEEVGQIVEANPTEAVSVLRHWMQEPA